MSERSDRVEAAARDLAKFFYAFDPDRFFRCGYVDAPALWESAVDIVQRALTAPSDVASDVAAQGEQNNEEPSRRTRDLNRQVPGSQSGGGSSPSQPEQRAGIDEALIKLRSQIIGIAAQLLWLNPPEHLQKHQGQVRLMDWYHSRLADAAYTLRVSIDGYTDKERKRESGAGQLTFDLFQAINERRCPEAFNHELSDWTLDRWTNALCGEAGEAANIAKKLARKSMGIGGAWAARDPDEGVLMQRLADEIGDVVAYASLLASAAGFSLADCVAKKFDAVSDAAGWAGGRLTTPPAERGGGGT